MCFLLIGAVGLFLSICFCKSDVTQCNTANYGAKDFAAGTSTQPRVCSDAANVCVSVIWSLTTSLIPCCCGSVDLMQETFDSSRAGGRLRRHRRRRIRPRSALYFRNIFLLQAPCLFLFSSSPAPLVYTLTVLLQSPKAKPTDCRPSRRGSRRLRCAKRQGFEESFPRCASPRSSPAGRSGHVGQPGDGPIEQVKVGHANRQDRNKSLAVAALLIVHF